MLPVGGGAVQVRCEANPQGTARPGKVRGGQAKDRLGQAKSERTNKVSDRTCKDRDEQGKIGSDMTTDDAIMPGGILESEGRCLCGHARRHDRYERGTDE